MKVNIVIPNYNGENLLKKNLPKVVEAANYYVKKNGIDIEIIIVDDCSKDKSVSSMKYFVSSIKNRDIKFKIIQNEKNLGFSSTVNRGIKETTGGIVILLNTDVLPEKIFLEPLLKHFSDPDVFAVGCLDKSVEDGKIVLRGRGIGKWQNGFFVHSRGEVDKRDTLWVSGGSGAFRKSIWEKLGGFDVLYNPFYWEDIDLSYRALKSGYKILFEPDSIVTHDHKEGVIKRTYSNFEIKRISYRNQFIFIWKNITDLDLQLSHWFLLPFNLIKALLRGDFALLAGFISALIKIHKIFIASFKSQKLFKKSDKEIIS